MKRKRKDKTGTIHSLYVLQIKNDVNIKTFRKTTLDDRNENIANITDRFYVFINFFNSSVVSAYCDICDKQIAGSILNFVLLFKYFLF